MKTNNIPALSVILMASFIISFTGSALNLSVPAISDEFSAGTVTSGWIITGYTLASASLSVPFGRFSDIFGRKRIFVTGLALFSVSSLTCGTARNIYTIILFRLLQGAGAAMIFATSAAILANLYRSDSFGKILGLSVSFTYLGLSTGPAAGGIINRYSGWRTIFAIASACCLALAIAAVFFLKRPQTESVVFTASGSFRKKVQEMDIKGFILYSSGISAFLYGLNSITDGWLPKTALIAGIILIAVFVKHVDSSCNPLLPSDIFRENRLFTISAIASLLIYGASYAVNYVLSFYLQTVRGIPSDYAGLIMITAPVFQAAVSPAAGRLSDRFHPLSIAISGMIVTAAGIFMLIFISEDISFLYIIVALAVTGAGTAIFSPAVSNAIMGSVSEKDSNTASSVMASGRSIGNASGMAAVSAVLSASAGSIPFYDIPAGIAIAAIRKIFAVLTAVCVFGIICSSEYRYEEK